MIHSFNHVVHSNGNHTLSFKEGNKNRQIKLHKSTDVLNLFIKTNQHFHVANCYKGDDKYIEIIKHIRKCGYTFKSNENNSSIFYPTQDICNDAPTSRNYKYTHLSPCEITWISDTSLNNQTVSDKPSGFWLGVDDQWMDFLKSNTELRRPKFSIEIEIVDTTNILFIETNKDIEEFTSKYIEDNGHSRTINWKKVHQDYHGIIIPQYMPEYRLHSNFDYNWFYSWDIPSGCIWNTSALRVRKTQEIEL